MSDLVERSLPRTPNAWPSAETTGRRAAYRAGHAMVSYRTGRLRANFAPRYDRSDLARSGKCSARRPNGARSTSERQVTGSDRAMATHMAEHIWGANSAEDPLQGVSGQRLGAGWGPAQGRVPS